MERYAYIVEGQVLILEKDEDENILRFSMRLDFISKRFKDFELDVLVRYSHIYVNKLLLGLMYDARHEKVLKILLTGDDQDSSELEIDDESAAESFEDIEFKIVDKNVEAATQHIVKFEDGTYMTTSGPKGHFRRSSGGLMAEIDGNVNNVALMKPKETSKKAGLALEVGDDIVQVCEDDFCDEPTNAQLVEVKPKQHINHDNIEITFMNTSVEEINVESLAAVVTFDDEDLREVWSKFEETEDFEASLLEISDRLRRTGNKPLRYSGDHDDVEVVDLMLKVRETLDKPANLFPLSYSTCYQLVNEDEIEDQDEFEAHVIEKRQDIHDNLEDYDIEELQDDDILRQIMFEYDRIFFESELAQLIADDELVINLKWEDIEGPAELQGSEKTFNLTLSSQVLPKIDFEKPQTLNGIKVTDMLAVVQIFIEQLLVEIAMFRCEELEEDSIEELAQAIFQHSDLGVASFLDHADDNEDSSDDVDDVTTKSPRTSASEIRQMLLDLHNDRGDNDPAPMVTLQDGREMESIASRSQTMTKVRVPGAEELESIPYEMIVKINDTDL